LKRIHRIGRSLAADLEIGDLEAPVVLDCPPAELEPVRRSGVVVERLVWRLTRRDQQHPVERQLQIRLLAADQVADVRRVEGPAEDADARACQGISGAGIS
jgi:hypothetical protein